MEKVEKTTEPVYFTLEDLICIFPEGPISNISSNNKGELIILKQIGFR